MSRRRHADGNGLQDYSRSETEAYSTDDEIDLDRGYAAGADVSDIDGRCRSNHEVEGTDEESDEDTDDDLSSCSDGDNYNANTKALIDRIKGRWQR
jgi:hypothetical protein